jgi:hypothetical protein
MLFQEATALFFINTVSLDENSTTFVAPIVLNKANLYKHISDAPWNIIT